MNLNEFATLAVIIVAFVLVASFANYLGHRDGMRASRLQRIVKRRSRR